MPEIRDTLNKDAMKEAVQVLRSIGADDQAKIGKETVEEAIKDVDRALKDMPLVRLFT
jgi:hypothetical protein